MNNQENNGEDRQFMRSYMNTEYTSLRNEINQYKSGQITLFTATASATGIMLGIFINLIKVGEFNLLHALLIIMPLIVIIPSAFMFSEKAVKINRLEAYCAVYTEQFMCQPKNSENYLGYSKYKSTYIDLCSKPIQGLKKSNEMYMTYAQGNLSSIKKYYNKWFIHKETKYWVNFCYAYWGLVCTCFIVYVAYAFGSISNLYEGLHIAVTKYNLFCIYISIFLVLTFAILYGRTFMKGDQYWFSIIFDQIIAIIFLIFLLLMWVIVPNIFILFIIEIFLIIITIMRIYKRKIIDELLWNLKIQNHMTEGTAFFMYLIMIGIFGLYLLVSLLGNSLSDRAFMSIIYLIIMATTIIWNFINTSSLILGTTSYKSAKERWVKCITHMQFDKKTKDYPLTNLQILKTEEEDSHKQVHKNEITDDVSNLVQKLGQDQRP